MADIDNLAGRLSAAVIGRYRNPQLGGSSHVQTFLDAVVANFPGEPELQLEASQVFVNNVLRLLNSIAADYLGPLGQLHTISALRYSLDDESPAHERARRIILAHLTFAKNDMDPDLREDAATKLDQEAEWAIEDGVDPRDIAVAIIEVWARMMPALDLDTVSARGAAFELGR